MIADSKLQPMVAAEYLSLADQLSCAAEADWNTPSLCDGWRVREVVAHVTMPARYDQESFMAELQAHEFDFARLSNAVAARDSLLPFAALVGDLRSEGLLHWAPPEGGYHGALNHAVIHGLDVSVPLGWSRCPPDKTMRVVLADLTEGGGHAHFGTRIAGRTLEATDLDWSYGSGPSLRGSAGELALAVCGRRLPPGRLQGAPL